VQKYGIKEKLQLKKIISLVIAFMLCISLSVPALATSFPDVPSDYWAYNSIQSATEKGVVSGYADGSFKPAANVTNAQFVVMLARAFYADTIGNREEDNAGQPWWWSNWSALSRNGILQGNENFSSLERFKENAANNISRYDMALLISGILNNKGYTATDAQKLQAQGAVTDYANIPAQYQEAVKMTFALGLITGYSDGSFGGTKAMNRAQGCVVIERLTHIINGETITASLQQPPAETSANHAADPSESKLKLRNGKAVTEDNVIEIINEVMTVYPIGTPWDGSHTKGAGLRDNDVKIGGRTLGTMSSALSTISAHSNKVSMEFACGGFAGIVSDAIFGGGNTGGNDFPARKIDDVRKVRPGDIIVSFYNDAPDHIIVATSGIFKTEQYDGQEVYYVNYYDGNHNEMVDTDFRYLTNNKYNGFTEEIWTRYPD